MLLLIIVVRNLIFVCHGFSSYFLYWMTLLKVKIFRRKKLDLKINLKVEISADFEKRGPVGLARLHVQG